MHENRRGMGLAGVPAASARATTRAARIVALTSTIAASAVGAQTATPDSTPEARSEALPTVMVTSRRIEENLQDVPIAVTALTGADLEARSVSHFDEIAAYTPNMTFATGLGGSSSQANVFVRGIGQGDLLASADPGVGMYVDGVYLGRTIGGVLDLLDIAGVEVLRGPQGTLFGKNTIGGAINVRTIRPSSEAGGKVQLVTGRYNRRDGLGTFNVPLVEDRLAARFSFASKDRDGYGRSLATGAAQGGEDRLVGKASLLWTPSDAFDLLLSGDYTHGKDGPTSRSLLAASGTATVSALFNRFVAGPRGTAYDARWVTGDPYTNYDTYAKKNDIDNWGVSATATWKLGALTLKSISAYRDLKADFSYDIDHSPLDLVESERIEKQDQYSEELQLSGNSLADRLNWIVGAYYFKERGSEATVGLVADGLYNAIRVDLDANSVYAFDNASYALFAQASYGVTDKLSVTLGARNSWDSKDLPYAYVDRPNSGARAVDVRNLSKSWSEFTPKAGLEYRVRDDLMYFASVDKGYRAGGYNGRLAPGVTGVSYDPEYVTAYQLGMKSRWLDGRMQLNAAAFHSDYKDIQVIVAVPVPGSAPVTVAQNAARAKIDGLEAEFISTPARGLQLSATVGYIDARFTEIAVSANQITKDSKFVKTPKWTGTVAVQYQLPPWKMGSLTLRADASARSGSFQSFPNAGGVYQDAYDLLGARMVFESANSKWQAALFGTNLGNKVYFVDGSASLNELGLIEGSFGRPREWGLSLTYSY